MNGIKYLFHSHESFDLVGVAYNGSELLELLSKQSADTLLLDLNMPGYSYYHLLKQVLVLYPKLKVIAFTAYNHPELVREVMDLGTHGFLNKTTGFQEIIEAVEAVHREEIYIGKQVQIGGHGQSLTEEEAKYQDSDQFLKEVCLTRRERDVLILVARGLTNQNIADRLFLSKHTIETHRKNIMRKMNFNSSAELIQFAVLQKMV
jgi:Response regulator containing a CheY-like receiver domain and an HTH DNA-binding domain